MKPTLFDSPSDLVLFINSLPEPSGRSQKGDAAEIKEKLLAIVPDMFELRKALVKYDGGVGNYKSLRRYAEAASDNTSREAAEALERQMIAIDEEAEQLLAIGASEDLVETSKSARTKVAGFNQMRQSVLGFKAKLKSVLERVEGKASALAKNISDNRAALKKILGADAAKIEGDYEDKVKAIKKLSEALDEYCELNISFLGLFQGG
jgi:hypothetical protein